jgi:hypothetical protein
VGVFVATELHMDEVHELKNTLSDFMKLNDTKYKFMDLKVHFLKI